MQRPCFRFRIADFSAISRVSIGLIATFATLALNACDEAKPRTYKEIAFKPLAAPMMGAGAMGMGAMPPMNASPVDIKVTWTLPEGWVIKDSANAMRIGSFLIPDPALANTGEMDPHATDVSVVQLAGDAGGLKANLTRWLGQIGIKPGVVDLDGMIKGAGRFKTRTGQEGMYVDLTDKLSGDMTQSKSIFGAIVQTAEYTVFVKAMGERAAVVSQRAQIKAFCLSLRIEGPAS